MSAVLGIIKTASTVEIAGAAAGPTMETAVAIACNSKLMSRVLEQRGKWH